MYSIIDGWWLTTALSIGEIRSWRHLAKNCLRPHNLGEESFLALSKIISSYGTVVGMFVPNFSPIKPVVTSFVAVEAGFDLSTFSCWGGSPYPIHFYPPSSIPILPPHPTIHPQPYPPLHLYIYPPSPSFLSHPFFHFLYSASLFNGGQGYNLWWKKLELNLRCS